MVMGIDVYKRQEEGIIFKTLNNPVEILADENDNVNKIRCIKMELGEPDAVSYTHLQTLWSD